MNFTVTHCLLNLHDFSLSELRCSPRRAAPAGGAAVSTSVPTADDEHAAAATNAADASVHAAATDGRLRETAAPATCDVRRPQSTAAGGDPTGSLLTPNRYSQNCVVIVRSLQIHS